MVKSDRFIKVSRGENYIEIVAGKQEFYQNSDEKSEDFVKIVMRKVRVLSIL